MAKIYVAKIEVEYEVDDNNYLHWEDNYEIKDKDKDEDFEPRSIGELIGSITNELAEIVYDGIRNYTIETMITVEEKGQ
jgi:hypothetical protein